MAATGRLVAVAAIFILLVAGLPAIQQAKWEASTDSQPRNGFNNTITVDEGTVHVLDVSNKDGAVYAPERDISVNQSGTSFRAAGNWLWIRSNGTIKIRNSSALTNNTNASVSGYYTVPTTGQNVTEEFAMLPLRDIGQEWSFIGGIIILLLALGLLAKTGN